MKAMHKGFTLIELLIVVAIVVFLAAVALPKYVSLQRDARVAKMQAIYGSIRTASVLAKLRCELDIAATPAGPCTATGGTANMDGTLIPMLNRYPDATLAGIHSAAGLQPSGDGLTVTGTQPITYTVQGAGDPATCIISYTAALPGAAPVITLDTSGC